MATLDELLQFLRGPAQQVPPPTGGWTPGSDAPGDATTYLQAMAAANQSLGAPRPFLESPHPGAWGSPPGWQFQPGAQLDPSQVNYWPGARNPWWGFLPRSRFEPPAPTYFDPVGAGESGGYPWGPAFDRLTGAMEGR